MWSVDEQGKHEKSTDYEYENKRQGEKPTV